MKRINGGRELFRAMAFALPLLHVAAPSVSAQRTFTVTPVKYFGDDAGEPAHAKLPADAGMLASAAQVCELALGSIAVYDARMKRIVIFDSAGKVVRHIGREGKGPGEFSSILSMDCTRGRIATFDFNLLRVTIFDTTGTVLKSIATGSANRILLRGDSIWGTIRGARTNALWSQHINDPAAKRVEMLPVDKRNPEFNLPGDGAYYGFGRDNDGSALVIGHLPGLWHTVDPAGAISKVIGQELLPNARGFVINGVSASPGQIDAIVGLGKDWIGLNYLQFEKERMARKESPVRRLAIYQRSGSFLGYATLPEPFTRMLATSARPREFYYVSSEPYFRIVRAVISEARK